MPRGLPPLTPGEIVLILLARAFSFSRSTASSHDIYTGTWNHQKRIVVVDMGITIYNDADMIKLVIRQSGMSREEFYGATPKTAKKIGLQVKK